MSWQIFLSKNAQEYLEHWKKSNPKVFKKCLAMLSDIALDPASVRASGKPERITGNLADCSSRRLNKKDLIVYQILAEQHAVKVLQCQFPYGDG